MILSTDKVLFKMTKESLNQYKIHGEEINSSACAFSGCFFRYFFAFFSVVKMNYCEKILKEMNALC